MGVSAMTLSSKTDVSADSPRQQQNREAQARRRARKRLGLVVRQIRLQSEILDALEDFGWLDPFARGAASAESDAVEKYLSGTLLK